MARYFRVSPAIWNEDWEEDTRTLAFYLLTGAHRTTEGLFKLPVPYIQADIKWGPRKIEKHMEVLTATGFIKRHKDIVLLVKALKYQSPQNDNQVKAVITALEAVPSSPLDDEFAQLAKRFSERLAKALGERLPERFGNALALALPPSQTPSSSPSQGEGGDVGAKRLEKGELPDHLVASGWPQADVEVVCGRMDRRLKFGGSPIIDPEAFATAILSKLSLARTENGNAPKAVVIEGVLHQLINGTWQEVDGSTPVDNAVESAS